MPIYFLFCLAPARFALKRAVHYCLQFAAFAACVFTLIAPASAYVLIGSKWPQPGGLGSPVTITYSYQNMFNGGLLMPNGQPLPPLLIRDSIEEALSVWSTVVPLHFVEVPDDGRTYAQGSTQYGQIRFRHIYINGPDPPPPASPIAKAQAYYPSTNVLGGDVEYDHGDRWQEVGTLSVPDILGATVHELGHSLGLGHTNDEDANMYWIFIRSNGLGTAALMQDDINGIRAVYGAGVGSLTYLQGTWQDRALLPTSSLPGQFEFENITSSRWVAAPLASTLEFQANGDTTFSRIEEFPTGFSEPFAVLVGGSPLGTFNPGDSLDFLSLLGSGVTSFTISGIDYLNSPQPPSTLPLKLAFASSSGSFTVASVPEPAAIISLFMATALCLGYRRRRSGFPA